MEPSITKSLPQFASKARKYFVWCLWFQFIIIGGVSDSVCIIVCLFIVHECACNSGNGFHLQPNPMPSNKQKQPLKGAE